MAKKDYQVHEARLRNFRDFVSAQGWTINAEKEIDYGYQIVVSDGKTKTPVAFYPSGKILVQGNDSYLKTALQLWRQAYIPKPSFGDIQTQPLELETSSPLSTPTVQPTGITRIGSTESGKGDYFGPLVIGAVYINNQTEAYLIELVMKASRQYSDERILRLAEEIKKLCPHSIITIGPKRYNEAYEKIQNLYSLLAWGHARALDKLLEKVSCKLAISDQFGNENVLQKALMQKSRQIKLMPQTEVDVAVATASILARAEFIEQNVMLSIAIGRTLPRGDSDPSIIPVGREIVAEKGKAALSDVAKLHFPITEKIVQL